MFSAMKNKIFLFKKKWDAALPVILFFLFLFYSVIFLFGTRYSIMVSFLTTAFQIRRQKKFTMRGICGLVLEMFLLCILAFFSTLNIPLCMLLNFVVPFLLVYLQTTQFNQKGYFTYAMAFVFLQLMPIGWSGILPLLGVMLYSLTVLSAALALYSFIHRRPQDYRAARKGMDLLARQFRLIANGGRNMRMQKEIIEIQSSLHKLAYDGRQLAFEMQGESKLHYYGVTSEALTYFYLVADQVKQYLTQPVEAINVDFYRKMLDIMWKMSAEAEQMIFIVQSGEIDEPKRVILHGYIKQLQISFQDLQHINWHDQEKSASSIEEIPEFPLEEAYLTHLMMKYVENAKGLFQLEETNPDAVRYYVHGK